MSTMNVSSKVRVPFAWENKPGIRKEDIYREDDDDDDDDKGKRGGKTKLPPPPYRKPESGRSSPVNLQDIPLPPCAFQSPVSSRRGSKRDAYKEENDPFLIAYRKCTNSSGNTRRLHKMKSSGVSMLSCKHNSCSVTDGSIVRISRLSIPKPAKQIIENFFQFDD